MTHSDTGKTIQQIEKDVIKHLGREVVMDMIAYVTKNPPNLWGACQYRNFVRNMVVLALYRDITNVGYKTLEDEINLGYPIGHNSIQVNTVRIRRCLVDWASKFVNKINYSAIKEASRKTQLPIKVSDAQLIMDSTDIATKGKRSTRKASQDWSFKLNGPGVRFMIVSDVAQRVVKVWGGYSPKLYDGTFLEVNRMELLKDFEGMTILADNHFYRGKSLFQNKIKFHVNYPEKGVDSDSTREESTTEEGYKYPLAKTDLVYNRQQKRGRARIEQVIGSIKKNFRGLRDHWYGTKDELNDLFLVSVGIYNYKKYHNIK